MTINDDQVGLEAVEMFSASLSLLRPSDAAVLIFLDVTTVNIIDDDGRCTLLKGNRHMSRCLYPIRCHPTSNQVPVYNISKLLLDTLSR